MNQVLRSTVKNFFEVNFPPVHYFAFTYYTTTCLSFAMNYKTEISAKEC